MKQDKLKKIAIASGVLSSAAITGLAFHHIHKKNKARAMAQKISKTQQIYLIGGGFAALAAATYFIEDGHIDGKNIHIIDSGDDLGGSSLAFGNKYCGYACFKESYLFKDCAENCYDLFTRIPSLEWKGKSLAEELENYNRLHPTIAQARMIDRYGAILNVDSMKLNPKDFLNLIKLMMTSDGSLDDVSIETWFQDCPHFYKTNFWCLWQSTFGMVKTSSALQFKRYLKRMIADIPNLATLQGLIQTRYHSYESIIVPMKSYLDGCGVQFHHGMEVKDVYFKEDELTVTDLRVVECGYEKIIHLNLHDLCLLTSGSGLNQAQFGDYHHVPKAYDATVGGALWKKLADQKAVLGNPSVFFNQEDKTTTESFTITTKKDTFVRLIEKLSGNLPGTGGLITFKESNWLLSIMVPSQPHFKDQDHSMNVIWGSGLNTEAIGNYVHKKMKDCTGEEILCELLHHLHFEKDKDAILQSIVNVIVCVMPYGQASFATCALSDRPRVVPSGSTNFAIVSPFVELMDDVVFTEEYNVRAARHAVASLLHIKSSVIPAKKRYYQLKNYLRMMKTLMK